MTPIQVVESIYEAFNRGDISHILSVVAPNATWHQSAKLPWGGDYRGPEGAAEFFRKLAANMETTAFRVNESVAVGDEVFSFGYYEGRGVESGRTGGSDWMFRWKVVDGKVVSYESYLDTASVLAAFPAAAAAAR